MAVGLVDGRRLVQVAIVAVGHIVIARGEQWAEAFGTVDWEAGELLVVGSSEAGPIERVFLGSRATKIVRHSPVPVLVVPRAATDNPANLH